MEIMDIQLYKAASPFLLLQVTKFFFFRQNKKRGVHYTSTPRFAETKSSNFLLHVVFFQIYKRRTLPRIEISKAHIFTPHRVNTPKGITNGIATLKTAAMPFVHKSASYRAAVFLQLSRIQQLRIISLDLRHSVFIIIVLFVIQCFPHKAQTFSATWQTARSDRIHH